LAVAVDAKELVERCDRCQPFANKTHMPTTSLKMIPLSWPFPQWGLVMVGPLRKSTPGGHTHLLVEVDKFFKKCGRSHQIASHQNYYGFHQVYNKQIWGSARYHHG
jgi:hypothetical protein